LAAVATVSLRSDVVTGKDLDRETKDGRDRFKVSVVREDRFGQGRPSLRMAATIAEYGPALPRTTETRNISDSGKTGLPVVIYLVIDVSRTPLREPALLTR